MGRGGERNHRVQWGGEKSGASDQNHSFISINLLPPTSINNNDGSQEVHGGYQK